jgi:hypothetical protein
MLMDRRNADEESMQAIILLNLYSDDGLASIDNSTLWDKFMLDFKKAFDVVEKDPDDFLGSAIEWDPGTGVIMLDASKYLREVIAQFDMVGAHPSPIPAPAGMKIYANESWDGDEKFRNLYQQYCGCINYAALIRPELSYYASQICRALIGRLAWIRDAVMDVTVSCLLEVALHTEARHTNRSCFLQLQQNTMRLVKASVSSFTSVESWRIFME